MTDTNIETNSVNAENDYNVESTTALVTTEMISEEQAGAVKPKRIRKSTKKDPEPQPEQDTDSAEQGNAPSDPNLAQDCGSTSQDDEALIEEPVLDMEEETAVEPELDPEAAAEQTAVPTTAPSARSGPLRTRRNRNNGVISIDGGRSELTDAAKQRNDLIDLSESLRNKKILIGSIHGVESSGDNDKPAYAVLYYGAYKIVIPVEELLQIPEDADRDYLSSRVLRRLGAEIEYVIKGIDRKALIAAASRLDAMRIRKREFYLRKDENGKSLLEIGSVAEARVVCVLPRGIFVELFGVEAFIPIIELSHLRLTSALNHYKAGERVLVKITEMDRSNTNDIKLELSVRQANEDAMMRSLERYIPGNLYAGVVTMISPSGIFVSLDDVTCLCSFPPRNRPTVGAQVCVRVRGVNMERKLLWGLIIR